jgi:hypothetical protein
MLQPTTSLGRVTNKRNKALKGICVRLKGITKWYPKKKKKTYNIKVERCTK